MRSACLLAVCTDTTIGLSAIGIPLSHFAPIAGRSQDSSMGICASCLGLNRQETQEAAETEGLLYEDTQSQYGTTGGANYSEPDFEELQRERQILEQICTQTSNELIDVVNHSTSAPGSKMANDLPYLLDKLYPAAQPASSPSGQGEDEAAWLQSTQGAERVLWDEVRGLKSGQLFLSLDVFPQSNGDSLTSSAAR